MPVSGVVDRGEANSFVHGDGATGMLISPEFQITRDHLAFLIGAADGRTASGLNFLRKVSGFDLRLATNPKD